MDNTGRHLILEEEMEEVKSSPFKWREGIRITVANKRLRCNGKTITDAFAKGILKEADARIMEVLDDYGYLNRRNIERAVNMSLSEELRKPDYKRNISNLVTHGVLIRYEISFPDGSRAPHAYSLSRGATAYMRARETRSVFNHLFTASPETITGRPKELLKTLAFNQFHLSFLSDYREHIEKYYTGYSVRTPEGRTLLNGVYRFPNSSVPSGHYDAVCVVLRFYAGWQKDYLRTLSAVKSADIITSLVVIAVCENDMYIRDAEMCRRSSSVHRDMCVFYTVDIHCTGEPILDYLYCVRPENNYQTHEIVHIRLWNEEKETRQS